MKFVKADFLGQDLQLCSKPKRDHESVMKVHNELFSKGRGEADITFYCKGVSTLWRLWKENSVSSTIMSRTHVHGSLQVGFSAPFLVIGKLIHHFLVHFKQIDGNNVLTEFSI